MTPVSSSVQALENMTGFFVMTLTVVWSGREYFWIYITASEQPTFGVCDPYALEETFLTQDIIT